jgi:nucleoside phosphorylase
VLLPRDGESYDAWSSTLETKDAGRIKVVALRASGMGMTAAAIRSAQAIARFAPRVVVMIGIAAGTRMTGRNYGDPLIADPCVDYASGKIGLKGSKPRWTAKTGH